MPTIPLMGTARSNDQDWGWRPGLDGLRAVAVLTVILFHFRTKPWVPGGAFGVDLFLVLSGFLITMLLLQEWRIKGEISLRNFYIRRSLRLFPALALFCFGYFIITIPLGNLLLDAGETGRVLASLGLGMSYSMNWAIAFGFHNAPGIGHLWSLALEEQFYLLWPVLLIVLLRFGRLRSLVAFTTVLLVLSLMAPAASVLIDGYQAPEDWRRLYYGADYRAHGLLVGSLAAQLIAAGYLRPSFIASPLFNVMASAAAVILALFTLEGSDKNFAMYALGGFPLLSCCCAVLVVYAAFAESGVAASFLAWRPLTYVGRRSYGIYLWHLPIGIALVSLSPAVQFVVGTALSIAVAEISFRLVEAPALRLKRRFSPGHQNQQRGLAQPASPLEAAA